jgi:hypothetical protein
MYVLYVLKEQATEVSVVIKSFRGSPNTLFPTNALILSTAVFLMDEFFREVTFANFDRFLFYG